MPSGATIQGKRIFAATVGVLCLAMAAPTAHADHGCPDNIHASALSFKEFSIDGGSDTMEPGGSALLNATFLYYAPEHSWTLDPIPVNLHATPKDAWINLSVTHATQNVHPPLLASSSYEKEVSIETEVTFDADAPPGYMTFVKIDVSGQHGTCVRAPTPIHQAVVFHVDASNGNESEPEQDDAAAVEPTPANVMLPAVLLALGILLLARTRGKNR